MIQNLFVDFNPVLLASFTKDSLLYGEYQPCNELGQVIHCYWVSPVLDPWEERTERVTQEIIVPDGCLDIIFEVDKQTKDYHSFIVGMMSGPISIVPKFSRKQIYAVRFKPAGAYPFLHIPLEDFTNSRVVFSSVDKHLERELAAIFLSEQGLYAKITQLDRFFLSRFDAWSKNSVITHSLASIFQAKGNREIKKLARDQYVSERHLHRLFRQWVGLPPKEFARIIRFQNVLRRICVSANMNWASLALESGYHDQAHLINEFKMFTGITPVQAVKYNYTSDFSNTSAEKLF